MRGLNFAACSTNCMNASASVTASATCSIFQTSERTKANHISHPVGEHGPDAKLQHSTASRQTRLANCIRLPM